MEIDAPGGAYREQPLDPATTALLSVDVQNMECGAPVRDRMRADKPDFVARIETLVIPNHQRLLAAGREAGVEIVFTVIESLTQDGRDRSLDHKISRQHAARGSWEGRVIDEVAPLPNEMVIPKTASGVFNATNIDYVLHNLGIRHLVIFGLVTDQCVESAIRDAADRGYLVTQVEDACAAYSEADHQRSVAAMSGHYCRTRSTEQVVAELLARPSRRSA